MQKTFLQNFVLIFSSFLNRSTLGPTGTAPTAAEIFLYSGGKSASTFPELP
jgi:hypothetical protein